jgi:Flp pilus assembly protein TadD
LAADTGGRFFHNSNDLTGLLERAYDHGAEYYLIGYYSTNRTLDGKFRKIQVDLPDTDYTGRTRAGYFAQPSLTIPAQVEVLAKEASVREDSVVLPYHVKLGASSLHFERRDNERVAAMSVQGRVYSTSGALLGDFFDLFSPKLPKGGKTPDTVQYTNRFSGSPGSYRLVLQFRDLTTGAVASIDQTIDVPVHKGLAVKPVFLEHVRAARALFSAGKYREAAYSLARAVEADPTSAGARVDLAMALLAAGNDAEADQELSRALEIDPRLGAAWMGRARLGFKQHRFVDARQDAAEAVRLLPSSGRAHYLLGAIQEELHADAGAAESYTRAIELDAGTWDAYLALARVLGGELGRREEAISVLEKYLARGGPDPNTARTAIARLRKP